MGRNEALTCELHELVKVLDAEDGLPELPEVELEHPGHGVDVVAVRHVRQGVLAPLKTLPEIVDLRLKMDNFEHCKIVCGIISKIQQTWRCNG